MAKRDPKWTGFYVEHDPVTSNTEGASRTRQEFAEECDINTIMARYEATGVISHVDQRQPMYADLTQMPSDLQTAMTMLDAATESFMSLPASVRKEFDNDPYRFVEFAQFEANAGRLREWGLMAPEEVVQPPMRVEVVNPAPQGESAPAPSPAPSGA